MSWQLHIEYEPATFRRYYRGAFMRVNERIFEIKEKTGRHISANDDKRRIWMLPYQDLIDNDEIEWPTTSPLEQCRTIKVGDGYYGGIVTRTSNNTRWAFGLNSRSCFFGERQLTHQMVEHLLRPAPSTWHSISEVMYYRDRNTRSAAVSADLCIQHGYSGETRDSEWTLSYKGQTPIGKLTGDCPTPAVVLDPKFRSFEPLVREQLIDIEEVRYANAG